MERIFSDSNVLIAYFPTDKSEGKNEPSEKALLFSQLKGCAAHKGA
jgi:hypothetical protein